LKPMKVLVTGGAGFIGSHLADKLLQVGHSVTVIDNLSQGTLENLSNCMRHPAFRFMKGDVTSQFDVREASRGCDAIFHLAANPEVRIGDARVHFEQNVRSTFEMLEAAVKNDTKYFVFTSSSTAYGEAHTLPTPEDYVPLAPISTYGTSKLASESLIAGYCHTYKTRGLVFRLANIVGPRARHGVVVDFIRKLRADPARLEVLGDGTQTKSYLLVDDCIEAMLQPFEKDEGLFEIYNIGSEDAIDVGRRVANIVTDEMKLKEVEITFSGGPEGGRGWFGDVKNMWLDISKLERLGWRPRNDSGESIRKAVRMLVDEV
jgi:UDP-glucose 4-epimerase